MAFRWLMLSGLVVVVFTACGVKRSKSNDDDDTGFGGAGGASSGSMTTGSMTTGSMTTGSMSTSASSTGGTTTASTGSSTGCDTGQFGTIDSSTCDACIQCAFASDCTNELAACQNNIDCQDFVTCAQNCGDQACVDNCTATYPTGSNLYLTLLSCAVCGSCPNNCDAATNCG